MIRLRGDVGVLLCDPALVNILVCLREAVRKNVFFLKFSQMWVGGVADSQTRRRISGGYQ